MIAKCISCGVRFETNRATRAYCSRTCSNQANGKARASTELKDKLYTVWSCGGGIQSTAIAVLVEAGKIPKPNYGIMVDCGYEKQETLPYMFNITIPRMKDIGLHFEMIDTLKYTNNRLTDGKGHVNIPAFRRKPDGSVSKLNTRCNDTWKVRVSRKWMKEQGIKNCVNWIGISTDEERRARVSKLKWIQLRYPLVELGMNREACIYEIARAGWPMPPRTSCIFCPQQDDRAWMALKSNYPNDWAKALEVEQIIQKEAPDVFLHRKCKPLEEIF